VLSGPAGEECHRPVCRSYRATMTVSFNAPDCEWSCHRKCAVDSPEVADKWNREWTIAYTVAPIQAGLRTGAIAVAGRTVYVNQAGAGLSTSLANIADGGVVNAASYSPLIAPGSLVAIYGRT